MRIKRSNKIWESSRETDGEKRRTKDQGTAISMPEMREEFQSEREKARKVYRGIRDGCCKEVYRGERKLSSAG